MAATTVKVEVLDAQWGYSDVDPPLVLMSGVHEVSVKNQAMLRALAGAEAAGAIKVKADKDTRARMSSHVESDSESFAKQQAAMESGAWQEGNLINHVAAMRHRLASEDLLDDQRAALAAQADQSAHLLIHMRAGDSYERAVARLAEADTEQLRTPENVERLERELGIGGS